MSIADRLKWAAAGPRGRPRRQQRPGVELVRVDPAPAPPATPPWPLRALPAPEHPLCRRCGTRHEPRPRPTAGGGMAAAYGRSLLPDPTQPAPLGRSAVDPRPLLRDQASAWQNGTPDPPPLSLDLAELRQELLAPHAYWWEQRER